MPRRRNQPIETEDESIDLQLTIRKNAPVGEFLRSRYFELHKNSLIDLECVVCLQSIHECCFELLNCGHFFHLRCISKLSKCPICRE